MEPVPPTNPLPSAGKPFSFYLAAGLPPVGIAVFYFLTGQKPNEGFFLMGLFVWPLLFLYFIAGILLATIPKSRLMKVVGQGMLIGMAVASLLYLGLCFLPGRRGY